MQNKSKAATVYSLTFIVLGIALLFSGLATDEHRFVRPLAFALMTGGAAALITRKLSERREK